MRQSAFKKRLVCLSKKANNHFLLSICPNNELPNFVAYLKKPKLHPELNLPVNRNEPWRDIRLPKEIDDALAEVIDTAKFVKHL